jgi:hypothetical protein
VVYLLLAGAAAIAFLFWRLTVVSSERDDAQTELTQLRGICNMLAEGQGLQEQALRDLRSVLGYASAQQDDPDSGYDTDP